MRPWEIRGAPTAAQALADEVKQPDPVPATSYIWAGSPGRVSEVSLAAAPAGTPAGSCLAWFYANTGAGTRLRVEVTHDGQTLAETVVQPASGFTWRSLDFVPTDPSFLQATRLRFTALDAGDSNVRAAYLQLIPPP